MIRYLCVSTMTCAALALCACASQSDSRVNKDDPGGPPISIGRVSQVVVVLPRGEFFDTDGNGFRDSARVVVYLFDEQSTSRTIAVGGDGTLRIVLVSDAGQRFASWIFPVTPERGMMEMTSYGWGYVIDLNINDVATDQFQHRDGGLGAIYTPADGSRSATTSGPASVLVGPTHE